MLRNCCNSRHITSNSLNIFYCQIYSNGVGSQALTSFYDIVHIWTFGWVLDLDIHVQICVPQNIDLVCGLVLIFFCGLLSVSDNADYP